MPTLNKEAKTVLITGASDGIGLELARLYARVGHTVIATGRKVDVDEKALFGDLPVVYIRADQAEPNRAAKAVRRALETLSLAGPHLCILNAGTGWTGDFWDEPADMIDAQITINLTAPMAIVHALADPLKAADGHVVFVGSTAIKGAPGFATYAATKAALDGFARSLWAEWRGKVLVSIVHPGPTRTAMHAKAGLRLGVVRWFFMSPKRAAKAVARSVKNRERKRLLSRSYGWGALFFRPKESHL
ncbi:MAG: SDR family NAD(P)-dependent oxidoreductase [Pseudomonadota bacterium]